VAFEHFIRHQRSLASYLVTVFFSFTNENHQWRQNKNLSQSIKMPKATRASRSKKVDTPLRQRKFAVPQKQVLEKVVTQDEEISVSLNGSLSSMRHLHSWPNPNDRLCQQMNTKQPRRITRRKRDMKHGLRVRQINVTTRYS